MKSPRNFDRLAGIYCALEHVAFGRDLERARFVHLDWLKESRSILVLGEGDGRCLEQLVSAAPKARIDCVDFSSAMLARAARRIAGDEPAQRVTFRQADLLTTDLPPAQYDAVITFFFLDCFTAPQVNDIMARIRTSLRPDALWLWADFAMPANSLARWRARIWLAGLYAYFRWQTGLAARELPPVSQCFLEMGFVRRAELTLQWGLVRSEVWLFQPNYQRMISP